MNQRGMTNGSVKSAEYAGHELTQKLSDQVVKIEFQNLGALQREWTTKCFQKSSNPDYIIYSYFILTYHPLLKNFAVYQYSLAIL